jgi:ethanolamine ammonia-lyase large subunit
MKLKELMEMDDNAKDIEIINKFNKLYNVNVIVFECHQELKMPQKDDLMLMYQTQPYPHHNIIYDYIKYARIVCEAKKEYEYCEMH